MQAVQLWGTASAMGLFASGRALFDLDEVI
jgi:hypothetical protein